MTLVNRNGAAYYKTAALPTELIRQRRISYVSVGLSSMKARRKRSAVFNREAHQVAHSVPRLGRLAPPNAKPCSLDRLYKHIRGPYKAYLSRDEGVWHVFWDGSVDEPTVRCETEEAAAAEVERLGALWEETAGRKVYFIGEACRVGGTVKIGIAYQPQKRLGNLRTASSAPLHLLGIMRGDREDEKRLHRKFSRSRLSGEWFKITPALKRVIEACSAPNGSWNIG